MARTFDEQKREELLAEVVTYLETHGVAGLSLRPLAADLGTSARMLVYYFGTKESLVAQAVVASRLDGVERLGSGTTTADVRAAVLSMWQQMTTGRARGSAALLAQVMTLAVTQPDQYAALATEAVEQAIDPLAAALVRTGRTKGLARQQATILVSGLRGLFLDDAVTGDRRRVNAAARSLIDLVLAD
jgi:AcrR family transcriptional regulator